MRRFAQLVVLTMLSLSLGLHWAALQTAAWTGMLVEYSRGASLHEAWQKTFDGQHPCGLCKLVQAGRAAEKEQHGVAPQQRLEPVPLVTQLVKAAPPATDAQAVVFVPPLPGASRADAPPVPPPRAA